MEELILYYNNSSHPLCLEVLKVCREGLPMMPLHSSQTTQNRMESGGMRVEAAGKKPTIKQEDY